MTLPRHLLGRLYLLGAMVAFEYVFCFVGRGPIPGHLNFFGIITDQYGQIPIFAYVVFLGLSHSRLKAQQEDIPFGRIFFGLHLLCIAAVLFLTLAAQRGLGWLAFDPNSYAKSAAYLLGTVLLALACLPLRCWIVAIRATGVLWIYATLAGVGGWFLGSPIKLLWNVTSTVQSGLMQSITLHAVRWVLGFFLPDLISDDATFTIGTPRYSVVIAGGCSGIEGLGLVMVFTCLWLWYFRKEMRFPQALLLVPCALGCSWLLNIVRLCALILIVNVSGSELTTVGLHANAGWISFIAIALIFSVATENVSWVRRAPGADSYSTGSSSDGVAETLNQGWHESPAIRAYLIPFLAILAAAFVSKAAPGNFEWLYPLRFVVAAIALRYFWPELKKLNWRFGWLGPAAGAAVFLMWMAPVWWTHQHTASPLGAALAALSPTARWTWIGFRVAAACLTVPIAEELAFRGYLARRLVNWEFDQVPFTSLTILPVVLSSVVFGLMHGQHWTVGILAGLAFAFALRWRGRMGDAVVAHAVSNLLLAAWVLSTGDWAQW